ncbi:hypothetical protein CYMTET_23860 [Cymbomonas tetramitiformis]|uniref:3'(2'),5'-bisphosphate nucleotidase n=1 Tax=Cymbomonas tetramitiformis TaxID=36881 RepID=A0AAE0FXK0_9CHLO|nr:hypothetical protein CYMTET_23860 [Cymbomonas tetramitiformis]
MKSLDNAAQQSRVNYARHVSAIAYKVLKSQPLIPVVSSRNKAHIFSSRRISVPAQLVIDAPWISRTGASRKLRKTCVRSSWTCEATNKPWSSSPELVASTEAVKRAMKICGLVRRSIQRAGGFIDGSSQKTEKCDCTPVTVADFAVQALLSLELEAQFPQIPLLAEEDSTELRKNKYLLDAVVKVVKCVASEGPLSEREIYDDCVLAAIDRGCHSGSADEYWVLDPIDGTAGFIRGGSAQYCIGLALMRGGRPMVGVMGLPNWCAAVLSPFTAIAAIAVTNSASAELQPWWHFLGLP